MVYDALGYYNILEIDNFTDEKSIKLSYRDKAKFWHPDHNTDEKALEVFQKLSVAYDVLKDTKTRVMYDLLSMVYTSKDFPDMQTLKIYKTEDGEENPFLRVFSLLKYTKGKFKNNKIVASYEDAIKIIGDVSKNNMLKGWLKPSENIKALKYNMENINKNKEDNFKMLIHNAVAYFKEDKKDKSYISAKQSLLYADREQSEMLVSFFNLLPTVNYVDKFWDFEYLKKIQLSIPIKFITIVILFFVLSGAFVFSNFLKKISIDENKINYYQEVRFNTGLKTVDDMVLSKVFNIPVDYDDKMIFHITSSVNIMHGPADDFDVLVKSVKNQTVRITGYTPDKEWYRVMIDDGNMGFVRKKYLKKGVGNQIPEKSKIIKRDER